MFLLFQILVCFLILNDQVIGLNKILFGSLTNLKLRKLYLFTLQEAKILKWLFSISENFSKCLASDLSMTSITTFLKTFIEIRCCLSTTFLCPSSIASILFLSVIPAFCCMHSCMNYELKKINWKKSDPMPERGGLQESKIHELFVFVVHLFKTSWVVIKIFHLGWYLLV